MEKEKKPSKFRNMKWIVGGTFIFFTIKGIITTSLIVGTFWGVKGCAGG